MIIGLERAARWCCLVFKKTPQWTQSCDKPRTTQAPKAESVTVCSLLLNPDTHTGRQEDLQTEERVVRKRGLGPRYEKRGFMTKISKAHCSTKYRHP